MTRAIALICCCFFLAKNTVAQSELDSSFQNLVNSIISQKDIKYLKQLDQGYWTGDSEPIIFEGKSISRRKIITYDSSDRRRLMYSPYDLNSGYICEFKGHKYAFIEANFHGCVGSFCLELFHFIYDYKNNKLNELAGSASPMEGLCGDVDHDDRLDYIYVETDGGYYEDTTHNIILTPYEVNDKGLLEVIKYKDKDCYIKGTYEGTVFSFRNFKLIKKNWVE